MYICILAWFGKTGGCRHLLTFDKCFLMYLKTLKLMQRSEFNILSQLDILVMGLFLKTLMSRKNTCFIEVSRKWKYRTKRNAYLVKRNTYAQYCNRLYVGENLNFTKREYSELWERKEILDLSPNLEQAKHFLRKIIFTNISIFFKMFV